MNQGEITKAGCEDDRIGEKEEVQPTNLAPAETGEESSGDSKDVGLRRAKGREVGYRRREDNIEGRKEGRKG